MKRWLFFLIGTVLAASCVSPFKKINQQHLEAVVQDRPVYSPWEINEAKLLAMSLSGALQPEEKLYRRVLGDIKEIRTRYGREERSDYGTYTLPEDLTSIRFLPPWEPAAVSLKFEAKTFSQVLAKQYDAWNEFNRDLELRNVQTRQEAQEASLRFRKLLHPKRLSELYGQLPGVTQAHPQQSVGSSSRIYPRIVGDEIHYLFDKAWGDCQEDCIYHAYWFFRSTDQRLVYEGFWSPQRKSGNPDWWEVATLSKREYQNM